MNIEERKQELSERVVEVARVSRVTAGGRRFGFRALVVVGDRKGKVGMGIGKANDVSQAIVKGSRKAAKRMISLPLKEGTIPFELTARFKMTQILLKPMPKGRGIIAGGVVRDICELAGVEDINAKILSASKNKINNAKAVFSAFEKMRKILLVKEIAREERQENAKSKV